jgi:hypothetical protein
MNYAQNFIPDPYKGLMPYSESDSLFFFGRESDRKIITDNLKALLRDGIVHSLHQPTGQDLDKKGRPKLAVILFNDWSKNSDPWVWKFVVRAFLLTNINQSIKILTFLIFLQDSYPLINIKQKIEAEVSLFPSKEDNSQLFIILDQFERYFLNQPEITKQQQFLQDLLSVIKHNTNIHLLICISRNFISELNSFKETIPCECKYLRLLRDSQNIDRIQEVKPENLDRSNGQQLFQEKFTIEPELVKKVLGDIKIPIPKQGEVVIETFLLQLIMDKLWRKEVGELRSHKLREATLTGMGETAKLVNYYLSDKIELLSDSEKDIAASIFHYLVTPDGYKLAQQVSGLLHFANEYRQYRNLPTPQYSQIQDLLNKLSQPDFRILRPLGQERYEIFHDLLGKAILDWQQTFIPKQEMDKITEEIKRLEQEAVEHSFSP